MNNITLGGFFNAVVTGFGMGLGFCIVMLIWHALRLPSPF